MTKVKFFSAALISAAVFATPALAAVSHSQHAADAYASAESARRYIGGSICIPAPRVGAFATAPWTNDTPCEPNTAY